MQVVSTEPAIAVLVPTWLFPDLLAWKNCERCFRRPLAGKL